MRIINSGSKRTKRAIRAVRNTRNTRATRKTEAPPVIPGKQRRSMPRPNRHKFVDHISKVFPFKMLNHKFAINFERLKDKLAPARVNNVICSPFHAVIQCDSS